MRYRTLLILGLTIGPLNFWALPAAAQEEMEAAMAAWAEAGKPGAHHEHLPP